MHSFAPIKHKIRIFSPPCNILYISENLNTTNQIIESFRFYDEDENEYEIWLSAFTENT